MQGALTEKIGGKKQNKRLGACYHKKLCIKGGGDYVQRIASYRGGLWMAPW